MSIKSAILAATALGAVVLILFDIDINLEWSMPRDVDVADAGQELRFENCVDERDQLIHSETFDSIDNPDVQREILMTRKEQAVRDCRAAFPEIRVTTRESFQFNVVDIMFRY